jgi:formylglycine-generating enzyme required for sulfatase activity
MLGNVWEWCEDGFQADYQMAPSDGSAATLNEDWKIVRGGAWICDLSNLRCAYRACDKPDTRSDTLGFRLCRTP